MLSGINLQTLPLPFFVTPQRQPLREFALILPQDCKLPPRHLIDISGWKWSVEGGASVSLTTFLQRFLSSKAKSSDGRGIVFRRYSQRLLTCDQREFRIFFWRFNFGTIKSSFDSIDAEWCQFADTSCFLFFVTSQRQPLREFALILLVRNFISFPFPRVHADHSQVWRRGSQIIPRFLFGEWIVAVKCQQELADWCKSWLRPTRLRPPRILMSCGHVRTDYRRGWKRLRVPSFPICQWDQENLPQRLQEECLHQTESAEKNKIFLPWRQIVWRISDTDKSVLNLTEFQKMRFTTTICKPSPRTGITLSLSCKRSHKIRPWILYIFDSWRNPRSWCLSSRCTPRILFKTKNVKKKRLNKMVMWYLEQKVRKRHFSSCERQNEAAAPVVLAMKGKGKRKHEREMRCCI